jgi:very-short-patch-repair endonuclease
MTGAWRKGKTFIELYGIDRANEIKKNMGKGKTYEEKFGIEKAQEMKNKLKGRGKGLTNIQKFGKEKAEEIANKIREIRKKQDYSYLHKKKGKKLEEILGIEKMKEFKLKCKLREEKITLSGRREEIKKKISIANSIDKNFIIEKTKERVQKYGNLCKKDWKRYMEDICSSQTISNKFETFDNFAKECGFEWKKPIFKREQLEWHIGKNEKFILDKFEQNDNIILERQFHISKYYIDGYDKNNNVAYEVDEAHHCGKYQKQCDAKRENNIKNILGCKFVRINERRFIKNIGQTKINNFSVQEVVNNG